MWWRKRLVRLHLEDPAPTIEGVFTGYVAGHYRLKNAKVVRGEGNVEALEDEAWVPRRRVVLAQTIRAVE